MYLVRRHFYRFLPVVFCALALAAPRLTAAEPTSALDTSNAQAATMADYETQLADLESQFGPYHRSLLEPLQSLTVLFAERGDFDQVAALLDRQLQITRTVLGFRNPDLIPLLQDIVANEIRLQDWEAVSDHLEHIRYLVAGDEQTATPALLEIIEQQSYWYLARVYLDGRERRARNFMEARHRSEELRDLAEETFGENSPEIFPWLYKYALNEYRLVELLNADDGIASDTIDRLVREEGVGRLQMYRRGRVDVTNILGNNSFIPVVEGDELVGEAYLRDAWGAVRDIGEIAEEQGDLEAQAMALIYEGDMQKVMNRGTAFRKYRDARELLLAAGVEEARIEQFFGQPSIIPVPELFLRLDDALAYQQQRVQGIETDTANKPHLGVFMAWQEGVPDVPKPLNKAEFLGVDLVYNQVDATLSVSSSGKVSSVDVISATPAERSVEREAWRALRDIQVRPAIIDGRARRTRDVHIRYLFLAEE